MLRRSPNRRRLRTPDGGGLANAIVGSLIMVLSATAVGTPIGILAGIYLAEYGQRTGLGRTTRFINDILLSAPSIVIGLFVYTIIVAQTRSFSGYAGVIALALIVIPVVVRTTENMLQLVPNSLREAAVALGSSKRVMILRVTLKAARAGVVTGVLLALARIAGETAPLLFTALSNQFFSLDLSDPMANLPVTIFKFALSPFSNWQQMAWAGVFLITIGCARAEYSGARAVPAKTLAKECDGRRDSTGIDPRSDKQGDSDERRRRRCDGQRQPQVGQRAHQDGCARSQLLLRQVPGAEKYQSCKLRKRRSPHLSVRQVAENRRCCAYSTGCTSCIRSSAPKVKSALTAKTS